MPAEITLVTEDLPSEILAERLLKHIDPAAMFTQRLGRRGAGYVVSKLPQLNRAAAGMKILAIVDRDSVAKCPIELIRTWLRGPRNPNLVVRFAEMEIESWILGDPEALGKFLDVPLNRFPQWPDQLPDPKQMVVNLARLSRSRRIREEMCPAPGGTAVVGPGYNSGLEAFLTSNWRVPPALERSPSLVKAERRLRELAAR